MSKIFITGSADGLGELSAKALIAQGHEVVLHARNAKRAQEALRKVTGTSDVLIGDLSYIEEAKELANQVNSLGVFDAVIHNAGVYQTSADKIFTVNTLAPYILTCLIQKPKRLIYLSSGMHLHGRANTENIETGINHVNYSDSKLYVVMLCIAIAQHRTDVYANAVDPGWVPTKMGGQGAPDNLQKGYETQAWLAVSDDDKAKVSGKYFHHQKEKRYNPEANNVMLRERLIRACHAITDIPFPQH